MANLELPFRGDQFSVTLNYTDGSGTPVDIDFSAVVFGRDGKILDTLHRHKPSALHSALVSSRDRTEWIEGTQEVPGDDVIHVLPKKLDPAAEAIAFIASAPRQPGQANDLNSSTRLEAVVSFPDDEDHASLKHNKTTDLKPLVSAPHPDGPKAGLGNGQQSMLVSIIYLDKPGWTVHEDLSTFNDDSFGAIVPELKKALMRLKADKGVDLDCCRAIEATGGVDEAEVATFTRKGEDRKLFDLASVRRPAPAEGEPAGAPPTKLRLDIGWSFWKKPKPAEGSEEEEDAGEPEGTDFALVFYDTAGVEVQQVSSGATEADGVKVGREFEEDPEPEAPEAEEAAEGEEGGDAEEGGEPKPPPETPALVPAEDPYAFTLRHVVFINLAELPKAVHSCVLIASKYDGGFEAVRHVRARMYDVSAGEDTAMQKAPTTEPREMLDYGLISKYQADAKLTAVALVKIYKEYDDSAFSMWTASGTQGVGEFVADGPSVKTALRKYAKAYEDFKAEETKLNAAAEESGEELAYEVRKGTWRCSVPSLLMPGESLEDQESDVRNVVQYEGPLASREARTHACARVTFAPKEPPEGQEPQTTVDTYFGGYADDVKSGPGIYLFAVGAAYVGAYAGGKREGLGYMALPDGGLYEGHFKADKFEGQGQYSYPDGSVYTGSWAGGLKHGPGVYWDTVKGCLRGDWVKGIVKGDATYDQAAVRFAGAFVAGMPSGPCAYTLVSHRTLCGGKFAAAHINDCGPTLRMDGEYSIPAGSGADAALDEDGAPIEDPDKPPLPAFPKYEGLGFKSTGLPITMPDVAFPPCEGLVDGIFNSEAGVVPVPGAALFSVKAGLTPGIVA